MQVDLHDIIQLVRFHSNGNDMQFYKTAMSVAAKIARAGHGGEALELRREVDRARGLPDPPTGQILA